MGNFNSLDPLNNFAVSDVLFPYSQTATTILIENPNNFPDPAAVGEYNIIWYDREHYPEIWNDPYVEIVRVIAKNGNTLTILRGQEGTLPTPKNVNEGKYRVILAPTKKLFESIDLRLTPIDTVSDLLNTAFDESKPFIANVLGYHSPGDGGGGIFYWDKNLHGSNHDGGVVIYKQLNYPSNWTDTTQLDNWFRNKPIASDQNAKGCFVRLLDNMEGTYKAAYFGGLPNISSIDYIIKYLLETKTKVFLNGGAYTLNNSLNLTALPAAEYIIEGDALNVPVVNINNSSFDVNSPFKLQNLTDKFTIKNIRFNRNLNTSTNGAPVLSISDVNEIDLDNVYVYTENGYKCTAIDIYNTNKINLNKIAIENNANALKTGISIRHSAETDYVNIKDTLKLKGNILIGIKLGEDQSVSSTGKIKNIFIDNVEFKGHNSRTALEIGKYCENIVLNGITAKNFTGPLIVTYGNSKGISLNNLDVDATLVVEGYRPVIKLGLAPNEGPDLTLNNSEVYINNANIYNIPDTNAGIIKYEATNSKGKLILNNVTFSGPGNGILLTYPDTQDVATVTGMGISFNVTGTEIGHLNTSTEVITENYNYFNILIEDNKKEINKIELKNSSINKADLSTNIIDILFDTTTSYASLEGKQGNNVVINGNDTASKILYLPKLDTSKGKSIYISNKSTSQVDIKTNTLDVTSPDTLIKSIAPNESITLVNLGDSWEEITTSSGSGGGTSTLLTDITHTVSDYQSLQDAINNIGTAEAKLLIDRIEQINTTTTIPENITLVFKPGQYLDVTPGIDLFINGEIIADKHRIINGIIKGTPKNQYFWAEWFGLDVNISDNTDAFNNALISARNCKVKGIKIGAGKFTFTRPIVYSGGIGIDIIGAGSIPKQFIKNDYPSETNWNGTILDFRPAGNLTNNCLTFGDNNVQVSHLRLMHMSIIGQTQNGHNVLRVMYAPQKAHFEDLMIVQTGDGNGWHIGDMWTGCYIKDIWIWNTNGYRSTVDNYGFWFGAFRNAGGDIFITNLNAGGFRIGRLFGHEPNKDLTGAKSERNIFMQGSQSIDGSIGLYIGYGISQMTIVNDWIERIQDKAWVINGNAREISAYECRIGCYQLQTGGVGIQLGGSDAEGITGSLYKRARVTLNNCLIHGLQPNTRGIVRYKYGQNETLYINNCSIIADGTLTATDLDTIYGIIFKGDQNNNRSVVLNQVDFGNTSAVTIPEANRIVMSDESETNIVDAKDILTMYVPYLHSEYVQIDKLQSKNTRIENVISYNNKILERDFSVTTTALFVNKTTPNYIVITNMNNANRAMYLPSKANSEGKYYIVFRLDGDYNYYLNVKENSSDGGTLLFRIYPNERYIIWNINNTWEWYKISENTITTTSELDNIISLANANPTETFSAYIIHPILLSTDKTIPENLNLHFIGHGKFTGGVTLTINGSIIASPNQQIFGSNLSVVGTLKNDFVYPEWFGAKGDGTTNDSPAIQKAINICNIKGVSGKTYALASKITIPSFREVDFNLAHLKDISTNSIYLIEVDGTSGAKKHIYLRNFILDLYGSGGLNIRGSQFVTVESFEISQYSNSNLACLRVANCFNTTIEKYNIHAGRSGTAGNIGLYGILLETTASDGAWTVMNNMQIRDGIVQRAQNLIYMNFTYSSSGIFIDNTAFLGGSATQGILSQIGVYVKGYIENIKITNSKTEWVQKLLFVDNTTERYQIQMDNFSFAQIPECFNFKGISGIVELSEIRFVQTVTDFDMSIFNIVDCPVKFKGKYKLIEGGTANIIPDANFTGQGTILNEEKQFIDRTSALTLSILKENFVITNKGATAAVTINLPDTTLVKKGWKISFLIIEPLDMVIVPTSTDTIKSIINEPGARIKSNNVGTFITLESDGAGNWYPVVNTGFAESTKRFIEYTYTSGTATQITTKDPLIWVITSLNGANQTIRLPELQYTKGKEYLIINKDNTNTLTVTSHANDGTITITTISASSNARLLNIGTEWIIV